MQIKCLRCLGKSERYERMMDLTVEIDGDIGTLEEALGQFTAAEILDKDNKYNCSRYANFCPSSHLCNVPSLFFWPLTSIIHCIYHGHVMR